MDNNIKKNRPKMSTKNIKQHSKNKNKSEKNNISVQFISKDPK